MKHVLKLSAFADEASPDRGEQIQALLDNHIGYLELRGVDGTNVADLSIETAQAFREELDAAGIRVWSIGSPAGKSSIEDDFAAAREQFEKLLEMAKIFGATCIRIFSFYGTNGEEKHFPEVCRRLKEFCSMAKDAGVILCHENEKGIYGDTAERCLALHKAIPELKAVFDPANFVQSGEDPWAAWQILAPYVTYCHIKDSLKDGSIVTPGEGDGCIPAIVADYAARGGEVLTLEPHLAEFVGLAGLEEEGDRSLVGGLQFETPRAAFDHAAVALNKILAEKEL